MKRIRLIAAESHCTMGVCEWSMVLVKGDKVAIAGFPHIVATVKSIAHGERIIRAHAFQHELIHRYTRVQTSNFDTNPLHLKIGARK